MLELVGLSEVADRRSGGFSLGMGQRLGIATALLGDPATLLLDEPVNGLDPEGIQWIRQLLRSLAAEGRSVLVSSHLMSEMALTADRLIVVGKGRLIAEGTVDEVVQTSSIGYVRVDDRRTRNPATASSTTPAPTSTPSPTARSIVTGIDAREIGTIAGSAGITLYELSPRNASLEEAFMELTRDAAEYHAGGRSPRTPRSSSMTATTITSQQPAVTRSRRPSRRRVSASSGTSRVDQDALGPIDDVDAARRRSRLAIGFGALIAATQINNWDNLDPAEQARFDPTVVQPQRPVPRPTRDRRARRPDRHLRVRHRPDPSDACRDPATPHRACRQVDHLRRRRVRRRTRRVVRSVRHRTSDLLRRRDSMPHSPTPACCGP